MGKNKLFILLLLLCLVSITKIGFTEEWHTPPDKWKEPRIYHSKFDKKFEDHISISKIKLNKSLYGKDNKEKKYSSNKGYWFIARSSDNIKMGIWMTEILVFNERDYIFRIELKDTRGTKNPIWINEKLLYVEIWWGKIVGTYFIFDVEEEKIIVKEMFTYGEIAFDQWKRLQVK